MEDFESSPEFQALVVAAAGKPERSMGESVIPAEPPQWSEVHKLALELLKQAPSQMSVHIYRIQAATHLKGFSGLHSSLQELHQLLSEQWDTLHPEPDLDDPDDMYYARVNLMRELSEQPAFAEAIYRRPLVSARGIGEFSTRDLDISNNTLSGTEEEKERCQDGLIRGAFAESDRDELLAMSTDLSGISSLMSNIESLIDEKTGDTGLVSLKTLKDRIELCKLRFMDYAADHIESAVEEAEPVEASSSNHSGADTASATASPLSSSLQDRDAVVNALNRVLQFYQSHEPSSPVRLLTSRAREFVGLSFFELLQYLAPQYKDDLPALLDELEKQPLAYLLGDTYSRFMSGNLDLESSIQSPVNTAEHGPPKPSEQESGNNHPNSVPGSRDEVVALLQDIESYYAVNEPSSPLPLILSDIRRLVNKRFTELVAEFRRSLPIAAAGEASD